MADADVTLWNKAVGPETYGGSELYQHAVLEQYKLYVEMADRVSSRRNLANTFFLTMNSGIVTAAAALLADGRSGLAWYVLLPSLVVLLTQCAAWWTIVRSYRQLNAAKYVVVGGLEERLPAFAYSRAEWQLLGEGRDPRRYLPLSHVEQWVPLLFALAYLIGFGGLVIR